MTKKRSKTTEEKTIIFNLINQAKDIEMFLQVVSLTDGRNKSKEIIPQIKLKTQTFLKELEALEKSLN